MRTNFSWGSEAMFCKHLLGAEKSGFAPLHVGVTPICNVRVRADGDVVVMDFHITGVHSPSPSCRGLNVFFTASEDSKNPCIGLNREELTAWGWKLPPLNASLQLIHIPKTGGTTLEEVAFAHGVSWGAYKWKETRDMLLNWNSNAAPEPAIAFGAMGTWQPCSPWHIPLSFFKARGESSGVSGGKQLTFCVVRNPMDRAISQHTFEIQAYENTTRTSSMTGGLKCDADSLNAHIHTVLGGARKDIQRVEEEFPLVTDLACVDPLECATVGDCHWLPQWMYVQGTCDHVLRFEHLSEDFSELMKRFEGTAPNTHAMADAVRRANASLASECNHLSRHDLDNKSLALLSRVYAKDFQRFGYSNALDGSGSSQETPPPKDERRRGR